MFGDDALNLDHATPKDALLRPPHPRRKSLDYQTKHHNPPPSRKHVPAARPASGLQRRHCPDPQPDSMKKQNDQDLCNLPSPSGLIPISPFQLVNLIKFPLNKVNSFLINRI